MVCYYVNTIVVRTSVRPDADERDTLDILFPSQNPPESVQRLTVICEYRDNGSWKYIEIPLQIAVTDVNDNVPRFSQPLYLVDVNEVIY